MRDSNRRVWERMDRLKDGGWHVSGYAVCRDDRPPDLILFCTRNADGEWWCAQLRFLSASLLNISAIARDTISNFWEAGLRKTRNSARGRLIFRLESLAPRKGAVSAWALDFSRGSYYYHLEGDRELPPSVGNDSGGIAGQILTSRAPKACH
jgi:hypothetical protein